MKEGPVGQNVNWKCDRKTSASNWGEQKRLGEIGCIVTSLHSLCVIWCNTIMRQNDQIFQTMALPPNSALTVSSTEQWLWLSRPPDSGFHCLFHAIVARTISSIELEALTISGCLFHQIVGLTVSSIKLEALRLPFSCGLGSLFSQIEALAVSSN